MKSAIQNQSMMRSNRGLDSMKISMKKQSIKNTFHPVSNLENVRRFENKYNIHLDDLMTMFMLKIELKRICKRKNSKTAFVNNNPNNTYVKMSKRKADRSNSPNNLPVNTTDEMGYDTLESMNQASIDHKIQNKNYTLHKQSKKQIIIKDSGKEIIMQEQHVESQIDSQDEFSHDQIISKHERGEKLTKDEMAKMEMIHNDLTQPLEEEIEEVKQSPNEIILIQNDEHVSLQTESKEINDKNEIKNLKKQLMNQNERIQRLNKDNEEKEKRAKRAERKLAEKLEEVEKMNETYEMQMNSLNSALTKLKYEQVELQGEIEKKNEFISLERNDKEGYSGLLEKLQSELNALKRENNEEKKSLIEKSKELEETESNLGKKIKELAESRSQIYDLRNQIAHLKTKNQKLILGVSGTGEDSKLFNEMAQQMESEKDILKFTQDEYDDHMKRIENIMTANETEKLLLQKEIERLGGEVENLREELEETEKEEEKQLDEKEREKQMQDHEEDNLRLQRKQRELEVMKDQNKKLFEDNKTLSNKYNSLKKFRKEIKQSSDQMLVQFNKKREIDNQPEINFDFTATGNPLGNIVLATQILKNENHKTNKPKINNPQQEETQIEIFNNDNEPQERKIRASPPIRSHVGPPPSDHFTVRSSNKTLPRESENREDEPFQPQFAKKVSSKPPQNNRKKPKNYIQIQKNEVLEPTEYDRQEYLNRSKSPRVS